MHANPAVESLLAQSAIELRKAQGNAARIRAAVADYLRRAYASQLAPADVRDLLGIVPDCVLDRAGLPLSDEDAVVAAYSVLDDHELRLYTPE